MTLFSTTVEAIVNNEDVDPGASSVAEVFSHDFWVHNISSKTSHKSYRPLSILSFRLNFWMSGGRHPFIFHLTNVLLHPLVCLLLLEVLSSWIHEFRISQRKGSKFSHETGKGGTRSVALVAALLFSVHPIHTESGKLIRINL